MATLEIITHCPVCGAPVYGPRTIGDQEFPTIRRTCSCVPTLQAASVGFAPKSLLDEANKIEEKKKDIRDTMHTK